MVAGQRNQDEFNNFMAKDLDPKCKKCRREGVKLFLKGQKCFSPKCPIVRRNYPPGLHGQKGRRGRMTEYGQQLREKQKAKRVYGILERQFRNYYQKAIKQRGDTGEIIQQLLEMRLDNVIYRSGFADSRKQARQMGFYHGNVNSAFRAKADRRSFWGHWDAKRQKPQKRGQKQSGYRL